MQSSPLCQVEHDKLWFTELEMLENLDAMSLLGTFERAKKIFQDQEPLLPRRLYYTQDLDNQP